MKTIVDYAQLVKQQHALNISLAPVETDPTASSQDYTIGQHFILDGELYKAKTAITRDDALVLDVNYEAAGSIEAQIETLDAENQTLTNNVDVLIENGAVNLAENKGTTTTHRGITFTVNADGTVTASGTNDGTGDSTIILNKTAADHLEITGIYKLSGCPSGGSDSTYYLVVYQGGFGADDYGDGVVFTNNNYGSLKLACVVKSGTDLATDITFKPMIAPVDYNGPYVPYAKTNKELTDDLKGGYMLIGDKSFTYSIDATAGTTKTYRTFFNEANAAWIEMCQSLADDEYVELTGVQGGDDSTFPFNGTNIIRRLNSKTTTSTTINVVGSIMNSATPSLTTLQIRLHATTSRLYASKLTANASALTVYDSNVIGAAFSMSFYYRLYRKVK